MNRLSSIESACLFLVALSVSGASAGTSVAVIPAPGTLLLGAIGSLLVHRFRMGKCI